MEPENISDIFFSLENPALYALVFLAILIVLVYLVKKEIIQPLTKKKKKLELENVKLASLYSEVDPDPIIRINYDWEIIDMNQSAEKVFKDKGLLETILNKLIDNKSSKKKFNNGSSIIKIEKKHYSIYIKDIEDLGYKHIYFHDITNRVKYEQEIVNYQRRLKDLRMKVEMVNEEEKQRIGKELHDGVGHSLSLLKMNFQNLLIKNRINEKSEGVINLLQTVDNLSEEVRDLSHQLKPRILSEFGLIQALKSLVDKTNVQGYMIGYVNANEDFRLEDKKLERNIYRICQEALNNIIKHSECKEFTIELTVKEKTLGIVITDDGKGFGGVNDKYNGSASLGLLNMRERAESVGGSLSIDSIRGMGTTVYMKFRNIGVCDD